MKTLLTLLPILSFFYCAAQTPSNANIEKAVLGTWDKPAANSSPKQAATIHSVKIGTGAKTNEQDKIDGIPAGTTVTIAQIDFTVREYYSNRTLVTHRVMIAKVYKDQFDEWATKSNGMKIIETKFEPAN